MSLLLNVLLCVGFAAAVAGAIHGWRRHVAARRADDLRALAARRGWSLSVTGERLGRQGALRIAPRGGLPWTARAADALTAYEAAEPRWAEGTLLALPWAGGPAPDLRRLLGDEAARLAAALSPVEAPEGLVVLASADPRLRVPLDDLRRVLADFRPSVGGERGLPLLVLSPEGLRLRLRHRVARADHMEGFVDLAQEVSRLIGP